MREIKFRAWDKKRSEMVYFGFNLIRCETHLWYDEQIEGNHIMQYTGLKDKNDKEIYEGDICNCHIFTQELGDNMGVMEGEREFVCTIEFDSYGVGLLTKTDNYSEPIWGYDGFHDESLEVIGNIHENPELLNAKT